MAAATILYTRRHWSPGQRAAAGAALLAALVLPWWLGARSATQERAAVTVLARRSTALPAAQDVRAPAPASSLPHWPSAATAEASKNATHPDAPAERDAPPPYTYEGAWTEGRRTTVILSVQGMSFSVRVPGQVDERYFAQSVGDDRLVLRDRHGDRIVVLPLRGTRPESGTRTTPRAPADPGRQVMPAIRRPPAEQRTEMAGSDVEPEN